RGDKWRAAAAIVPCGTPAADNSGRIGCRDPKGFKCGIVVLIAESDVGALVRSIGGRRLDGSGRVANKGKRYGYIDTTKVVAIKQIRVLILTHRNHQMRRGCTRYVHEQRPA